MGSQPTLYDLLQVNPDATVEEIRRAYYAQARRLHPDVDQTTGATERFLQIQTAYEVLIDPERRSSYDAGLAERIQGDAGLKVSIQYSRATLPALDEPQMVYALLKLAPHLKTGAAPKEISRSPLNVSLVIDRSTSMQGERMDTVKAAAVEVIRQLGAEDVLSIIVFNDRAEVLMPSRQHPTRSQVETQVRMIATGGGTEIFQGLQAGLHEIYRRLSKTCVNHLILITDGRTYGDEQNCIELADEAVERGVAISTLGIGEEWNDNFLDDLAARTGGASAYVSQAEDIRRFLQDRFQELEKIYAERVKLEIKEEPGVELRYAFRLEPEPSAMPVGPIFHLGGIPERTRLALLLEFVIPPQTGKTGLVRIAQGNLSWVIPAEIEGQSSRKLALARQIDNHKADQPPPEDLVQALSQVSLYRLQERARQDISLGKVERGTQRLQHLANNLLSQGKAELARTVMLEAQQVHATNTLSERGQKQIKYGTRNLILPPGKEKSEP